LREAAPGKMDLEAAPSTPAAVVPKGPSLAAAAAAEALAGEASGRGMLASASAKRSQFHLQMPGC
jgi:hypothetical protein